MALLDLSLVTSALVKLIDESIKASPAWGALPAPFVTGLPPDSLSGDNSVGIYLYHLSEEAAHKNQPWPGRPLTPIRYSPMGLNLHYVLSAHSDLEGGIAPLREQLLMGLAVKALHDHPVLDDATTVAGVTVFPPALVGDENKLRIQMRPLPPSEAVSYWTAGSRALRLSAYYEVQVVLLEPEEPPTGGGRVLVYNIATFVGGLPRLETSRSTVTFTIPGETAPRSIEVQPAQAAPDTEVVFIGLNLTGDRVSLLVRGQLLSDFVEVDPAWGGVASGERFYATVRSSIAGTVALPGTYGAVVKCVRTFVGSDGVAREIEQLSNEAPFVIVPGASIGAPSPTGVFTVTGGPFSDPALPASALRVYVSDTQLVVGTPPILNPGEYTVLTATSLEARIPSGFASGTSVPVRIVVNGAESPPRWVKVP